MNDTFFYLPEDKIKISSCIIKKDNRWSIFEDTSKKEGSKRFYSGGGIITVEDYYKFLSIFLNKK